jgi:hypothetical protein
VEDFIRLGSFSHLPRDRQILQADSPGGLVNVVPTDGVRASRMRVPIIRLLKPEPSQPLRIRKSLQRCRPMPHQITASVAALAP